MGWIRDRWAVLQAALGLRRFLLAPIIGTVVGSVDWVARKFAEADMGHLIGVPSWAVGIFAATFLVFWWVLEYAVKLRKQIKGTRTELSRLREEGVGIRNAGMSMFSTRNGYDAWKAKTLDWNSRVIEEIRKINEADAEWFKVLDVVKAPRLQIDIRPPAPDWMNDHKFFYKNHDFRLKRLGEMIQNLWRD